MVDHPDHDKYPRDTPEEVKLTQDYRKWVFDGIYRNFAWRQHNNTESRSGAGSGTDYTINLRHHLPIMCEQFNIKSILDAPCGDFNWMKLLLDDYDIHYTGGDIVSDMIQDNKTKYPEHNFLELDVVEDDLPYADLFFCRDLFFHLQTEHCQKIIQNFLNSGIPYICLTSHKHVASYPNAYVNVGEFRLIDVFREPFNFPKDVLYRFDDSGEQAGKYPPRDMILLKREQLL